MRGDDAFIELDKMIDVSIRAPRVRGDEVVGLLCGGEGVSIRAPRVRGDAFSGGVLVFTRVSIRAPRVRGDSVTMTSCGPMGSFNPRPSCEGRFTGQGHPKLAMMFQSAPLV